MERNKVYFASDVHLGLEVYDPAAREERFISFLRRINAPDTAGLVLLGDIWDFWYEWKYTVPKGSVRVLGAILDLIESGIDVYFCKGNHDIWAYGYFTSLGMKMLKDPSFLQFGGKTFCVGHGDKGGHPAVSYRIMRWCFHNKVLQALFSSLIHPTIAMGFGRQWSKGNRLKKRQDYQWQSEKEPLYLYAAEIEKTRKVDYFIFGHLHVKACENLPGGAKLIMLDSWFRNDGDICIEI